jgi:hypothetical protein
MKVDKRQYSKTEGRVQSIDIQGPLFLAGYSEKYTPTYLSVRTKQLFHGNLRNLKINEKQVEWLAPRPTAVIPEFFHLNALLASANLTAMDKRIFETTST